MKHAVITDKLPGTKNFEKIENIDIYRAPPVNIINVKSRRQLITKILMEIPREINKNTLLNKIQFDILHLRGPYLANDFFYGIDCYLGLCFFKKFTSWRFSKKPTVLTFHTLLSSTKFVSKDAESSFWYRNEKNSWKGFEKFLCNHSREIICVDQYMLEPLKQISNGKQVHYIPSGIDLSIFKPIKKEVAINSLPEKFKKLFKDFNVLFVGRLDQSKGLKFLKELADIIPSHMRLIHIGSGKLEIESDKIVTLGSIENNLVPILINACDAVFSTGVIEGIGRISLESMACGKPTIMLGKHLNRYPLVDHENGFVVDSPSQAAEILIELFKSESFYKKISCNTISTSKQFDVRLLTNKIDKIYESL